jgi:prephenate dehydrogenase
MSTVKKIAIVGMGLIGGSIGMAVRKKHLAEEVMGIARRKESLEKALEKGAIDKGATETEDSFKDADLVIVALPVGVIPETIRQMVPYLKPGCIITDVGSTKKNIVDTIDSFLPERLCFIGSHPLAGSEKSGIDSARDSLFTNTTCIVTPGKHSPSGNVSRLRDFWEALETQVLIMPPGDHDLIVALTSHLPHLAAAGLVNLVEDFSHKDNRILPAVASGFRDTTRIAGSSPVLWHDICMSNRKTMASVLRTYRELLEKIEQSIMQEESADLLDFLKKAEKARNALNNS